LKVVLDSNEIVAAFAGRGLCNSLFEACIENCSIAISGHIIDEVCKAFVKRLKMPEKRANEIVVYLRENYAMHEYARLPERICRDRDDDEILALAAGAGTDFIISGDKDLLELKEYGGIKIVAPRDFWLIMRERGI